MIHLNSYNCNYPSHGKFRFYQIDLKLNNFDNLINLTMLHFIAQNQLALLQEQLSRGKQLFLLLKKVEVHAVSIHSH